MTVTADFGFRLLGQDGNARLGVIDTPRGEIRTPAFMPVGTAGTVKAVFLDELRQLGTDIILGNTYHLMLRPGAERIARLGGLNSFIGWPGPILTDSGGFQVMSLAKLRVIDEQGVTFASHIDGSRHELTPERAMEIQHLLGSTIQMQLDECLAFPHSEADCARAMRQSLRWAERSLKAFRRAEGHACFGILQGGIHPALRAESARALAAMEFDGYAIGGLAVGESQEQMLATIDITAPLLPDGRPRYLMGVGTPPDIVEAVARGIDMFDCVIPTRSGRHGQAFTRFGKLNLKNARHADDPRPLDETSSCPAATRYSRAYLHHLVKSSEILGMMLLSLANLAYYQELMAGIRQAIAEHRFLDHRERLLAEWNRVEEQRP
jgi:queuine tRNA-ribosyltransferase